MKRIVFVAGSLTLVGSPLPPDEEPPFKTSWVFSRECQNALCDILFGRIVPNREWMSKLQFYEASKGPRYPLWDRLFTHSIRPDGAQGMLLPYHDYLEPTGEIALSTLVRTLGAVRKIRLHGIASGPWEKREEWLNEQIP